MRPSAFASLISEKTNSLILSMQLFPGIKRLEQQFIMFEIGPVSAIPKTACGMILAP